MTYTEGTGMRTRENTLPRKENNEFICVVYLVYTSTDKNIKVWWAYKNKQTWFTFVLYSMLWNFSSLNNPKVQNEDKNLHTRSGWEMVTFFSSWEFFARSCENQLSFFSGSGWICLSLVRCLQLVGMFCHWPSPSHSLTPLSLVWYPAHCVMRLLCIELQFNLRQNWN